MKICKRTLEKFSNDNTLDLFSQQSKIYVFNLESKTARTLTDIHLLTSLENNDVLLMPEGNEELLALPCPKKVSASDIKPICLKSAQRQVFGKLIFSVKLSKDNLSIWYNDERIYEEPIFLMLSASDEIEEEDLIFEDRIQYLFTILKSIYGNKAQLQFKQTYPTVNATKDLWLYFSEQLLPTLDECDYTLMRALKVMVSVVTIKEEQVDFMAYLSRDVESGDVIDILLKEYVRQCGISLGYRAAIWDSMMAVYSYFSPQFSQGALKHRIYFRAYLYLPDKLAHFDQNDAAMLKPLESISYQMELFINADEECKRALAIGLMCFSIVRDRSVEYLVI